MPAGLHRRTHARRARGTHARLGDRRARGSSSLPDTAPRAVPHRPADPTSPRLVRGRPRAMCCPPLCRLDAASKPRGDPRVKARSPAGEPAAAALAKVADPPLRAGRRNARAPAVPPAEPRCGRPISRQSREVARKGRGTADIATHHRPVTMDTTTPAPRAAPPAPGSRETRAPTSHWVGALHAAWRVPWARRARGRPRHRDEAAPCARPLGWIACPAPTRPRRPRRRSGGWAGRSAASPRAPASACL